MANGNFSRNERFGSPGRERYEGSYGQHLQVRKSNDDNPAIVRGKNQESEDRKGSGRP
jgi:hypothetical protein